MGRTQSGSISRGTVAHLLPMALAVVVVQMGCTSNLDFERARRFFDRPPAPTLPTLRDDAAAAELPGPDGLRARSGELRVVPLRWDPLLIRDVGGYAIERAPTREGPFLRIASVAGAHATSYIDRPTRLAQPAAEISGGDVASAPPTEADRAPEFAAPSDYANPPNGLDAATWYYRVRAFTLAGQLAGTTSNIIAATTAATPAPPDDLRTYSHQPRKVPLGWRASSDPTVAGYRVERSPTSTGPFELATKITGRHETTWIDQPLGDLRVFYYRVAAVNSAGGEGLPSDPERAVTKPEPLPPIGLRVVESRLGSNQLAWESNVEPDVARYQLLRRRGDDGDAEVVATLEPWDLGAIDHLVGAAETVYYSVVVFDEDGLVSAQSDPVRVRSEGYGLRAEYGPEGVRLEWDPREDEGFQWARVTRHGILRQREFPPVAGAEFVDSEVQPGRSYRYSVALVGADGRMAPRSNPIEVTIPEE